MKSIQQAVTQKTIELRQMLDDSVREKEHQLRELQTTLARAQQLLAQLLESEATTEFGQSEEEFHPAGMNGPAGRPLSVLRRPVVENTNEVSEKLTAKILP
jgi:hypothetical protein